MSEFSLFDHGEHDLAEWSVSCTGLNPAYGYIIEVLLPRHLSPRQLGPGHDWVSFITERYIDYLFL